MSSRLPVYLLVGDDDLLLRRALERLLNQLQGADPELVVEQIDAGEAAHLPELRTAALFGGGRCVVLRRAEAPSAGLADELADYLADPAPDATLILVARGTGRIRGVAKRATEVGERLEVTAPKPWARRDWEALAADELRRLGHRAEPAALRALLDHAGLDPSMLASKCAQVAAAVAPGAAIRPADVERVVEGHGNPGGFALADAVVERDVVRALVALRGALEAGEAPLALLGAIIYRIRQLLHVQAGGVAGEVGLTDGQYRRLAGMARRFAAGELAWCHGRLARADLDLKGSDLPPGLVLELAVIDLASPREGEAPRERSA